MERSSCRVHPQMVCLSRTAYPSYDHVASENLSLGYWLSLGTYEYSPDAWLGLAPSVSIVTLGTNTGQTLRLRCTYPRGS